MPVHYHQFKSMSIPNQIPFRVCGQCQSVLRWHLRLTFGINANYSNGLAKRLGFFLCCKLEEMAKYPCFKHDEFAFARQVSTVSLILSLLRFKPNKWPAAITNHQYIRIRMLLFPNPLFSKRLISYQKSSYCNNFAWTSLQYSKLKHISNILGNFLDDKCT